MLKTPSEERFHGGPAVAAVALLARSREARDEAGLQIDPAHAVVEGVGDVEQPVRPYEQVVRPVELRAQRRPIVAAQALLSSARHDAQVTLLVEHADAVSAHLDDVGAYRPRRSRRRTARGGRGRRMRRLAAAQRLERRPGRRTATASRASPLAVSSPPHRGRTTSGNERHTGTPQKCSPSVQVGVMRPARSTQGGPM